MKERPASQPNPSDPDRQSDQYRTLGGFLWAVFDPHLHSLEKPLSGWARFWIALSGSGMLFGVFYLNWLSGLEQANPNLTLIFSDIGYGTFPGILFGLAMLLIVLVTLSIYFAVLVAVVPTKAGPVRLFLAGLLIPALACHVVLFTWNFGASP